MSLRMRGVLVIVDSGFVSVLLLAVLLPWSLHGSDFSSELNQRYAPYANWESRLSLESLAAAAEGDIWWRSPEEIRRGRSETDSPLSGLRLALDPGHVGGEWAEVEGRNFKIHSEDWPVREGELVLEVAHRVQAELVKLGAEVTLLRDSSTPLNPKPPEAYLSAAAQRVAMPEEASWASLLDYGLALRGVMQRMSVVTGELIERARLVNEEIRPDALVSLHMNAAPWPVGEDGAAKYELVDSNHTHVLIFGCLSDTELSKTLQQEQLLVKLTNGSGKIECELGQALGISLGADTELPPSNYAGKNAVRLDCHTPYLWARNLMLLRYVECPVVLLEPYIANSKATYPRIQQALQNRADEKALADDDILLEYTDAVIAGLLKVYGPVEKE